MKVLISLFAIVAVAIAAPSSNDHLLQAVLQAKFNAFKAQHGKTYASPHEEQRRLNNFLQTTHAIETHNERFARGLETFTMGHNDMSDLSFDEYLSTRLGAVRPEFEAPDVNVTIFRSPSGFTRPASVNWKASGYVTPVKNQGGCGSCYAFATVGALESMHLQKTGRTCTFSEQQLVDCSGGHGNGGCSGGWMHNCFKYIMDNGGINEERNYPYEARVSQCRAKSNNGAIKVKQVVIIPRGDEEAMAKALSQHCLTVAYDASTREHMSYRSGIYHSENCDSMRTSHAVTAVGYGTENGVDYWLCKNSWGTSWGEGGFFKARRNTNNKCGFATCSSYPVLA